MSRIGKLPIILPPKVTVSVDKQLVTVNGPKGKLEQKVHPDMTVNIKDNVVTVTRPSDSSDHKALHGLTRSLLANMVTGVSTGFTRDLEIVGVGYRAEKQGDKLILRVGMSHTVEMAPLPGITFGVEANTRVKVSGADKQVVGEMAARIRAVRPPDAYKGKGVRYAKEVIRLKPGKAGKVVGKK